MANTLHRVEGKTGLRDALSGDPALGVAPSATGTVPRTTRVGITARAIGTVLLGASLFLAAVAIGAFAMHWATTYQGHRARFTPASLALLIGWVAVFGLPEAAEAISRYRAANRGAGSEAQK